MLTVYKPIMADSIDPTGSSGSIAEDSDSDSNSVVDVDADEDEDKGPGGADEDEGQDEGPGSAEEDMGQDEGPGSANEDEGQDEGPGGADEVNVYPAEEELPGVVKVLGVYEANGTEDEEDDCRLCDVAVQLGAAF
jgi:hypothetical protein